MACLWHWLAVSGFEPFFSPEVQRALDGGYGSTRQTEPVSSSDFGLERSGLFPFCQRITNRRGGSASAISPASRSCPSPLTCVHGDPGVQSLSHRVPNQYCFMNAPSS